MVYGHLKIHVNNALESTTRGQNRPSSNQVRDLPYPRISSSPVADSNAHVVQHGTSNYDVAKAVRCVALDIFEMQTTKSNLKNKLNLSFENYHKKFYRNLAFKSPIVRSTRQRHLSLNFLSFGVTALRYSVRSHGWNGYPESPINIPILYKKPIKIK